MAAVQSTHPARGQSPRPNVATASAAVHRALDLLGRASEDWRNGTPRESGSLHWPVAVNLARRELRQALDNPQWRCVCGREHCPGTCLESLSFEEVENARGGIAWWNRLSRAERRHWLEVADSAVPADAWEAYKLDARP